MAKTNNVDLCGYLTGDPLIINPENGNSKIIMHMIAGRGTRDTGDGNYSMIKTNIPILSKDSKIIKAADNFKKYDFIRIKGVITTAVKEKTSVCPKCGKEYVDEKMITYIEPIYIERIEECMTEEKANEALTSHLEVSEEIRIIGHVTNEPQPVRNFKSKISTCQYQVAVTRTYRICGSKDEEKSDFPWVKSYGKNAKEDLKRIKVGTSVLIDGALQSRPVKKSIKCEHCGNEFSLDERFLLEVIPYETEYLNNYTTDKELEADPLFSYQKEEQ